MKLWELILILWMGIAVPIAWGTLHVPLSKVTSLQWAATITWLIPFGSLIAFGIMYMLSQMDS